MAQHRSSRSLRAKPASTNLAACISSLYEPMDCLLVRAPLFPIETYYALSDADGAAGNHIAPWPCTAEIASHRESGREHIAVAENRHPLNADRAEVGLWPLSIFTNPTGCRSSTISPFPARESLARRALAVGSLSLLDAVERPSLSRADGARRASKLLRYLIRMSTRPTPYGLFAGVALAQWGEHTDLTLAAERPHTRTRPDMEWLYNLVMGLEARPEVRKHLRLIANSAALHYTARVFLTQRVSGSALGSEAEVSLRATGAVQRALAAARQPISYQDLCTLLLQTTPGATSAKVERLLTELWQCGLLLTNLRPPLTTADPARYVAQCLASIPEVHETLTELEAILNATTAWDALPPEEGQSIGNS